MCKIMDFLVMIIELLRLQYSNGNVQRLKAIEGFLQLASLDFRVKRLTDTLNTKKICAFKKRKSLKSK